MLTIGRGTASAHGRAARRKAARKRATTTRPVPGTPALVLLLPDRSRRARPHAHARIGYVLLPGYEYYGGSPGSRRSATGFVGFGELLQFSMTALVPV